MKGKRKLIFEIDKLQLEPKDIQTVVYEALKSEYGVKYSDDITMYFNLNELMVYCVVNNNTYKVGLGGK